MARTKKIDGVSLFLGAAIGGFFVWAGAKIADQRAKDALSNALGGGTSNTGTLASTTSMTMPGTAADTVTGGTGSPVPIANVAPSSNISVQTAYNAGRLSQTANAATASGPGFGLLR